MFSDSDDHSLAVVAQKPLQSRDRKGADAQTFMTLCYLTGATRRIGAEYVRRCVRILQSLEVAVQPEDMKIAGYRFHGPRGKPRRWAVRVTGNCRIGFGWSDENAQDVDFEETH